MSDPSGLFPAVPRCPRHDVALDRETGCDLCATDTEPERLPAAALATRDLGRLASYQWEDQPVTVRLSSLARTRDGKYIELTPGHEVRPAMRVTLLDDDRIHTPGYWLNMDEDTYYGDPVRHLGGSLSASMAKILVQPGGPAKLRWRLDHPAPPKAVFDLGHAAHTLVLGVGSELALIPHDHWGSKDAKAAVAEARAAGQIPLKPADWNRVHAMADRVAAHPLASRLLDGIEPEVSALRQHDSGAWLRSRFDGVGDGYVVDFKTARSADPEQFRRDAANLGYHLQAAAYTAMADALPGLPDDPDFCFIVQEKEPPYLVSVVELSPAFLAIGRAAYEHAIDLWAQCATTNEWPGYPGDITTLDPPGWLTSTQAESLDPAIEAAFAELLGEPA